MWRGLLFVEAGRGLRALARLLFSPTRREALYLTALAVGLVAQLLLLQLLSTAVDTSIDLARMWVELARKHLEITLSR